MGDGVRAFMGCLGGVGGYLLADWLGAEGAWVAGMTVLGALLGASIDLLLAFALHLFLIGSIIGLLMIGWRALF